MSKQKKPAAFTSLRIIGEKAHKFLTRASAPHPHSPPKNVKLPEGDDTPSVVVHISLSSVVRAAFAVVAIAALIAVAFILQETIVIFFLALILAIVIDPGVDALERLKIPRGLAVILHYVIALLIIAFLLTSLIPVLARQLQDLAFFINAQVNAFLADPQVSLPFLSPEANVKLTNAVQAMLANLSITRFTDALQQLGENLSTFTRLAADVAGSVISFIANLGLVLVLAFFIQLEKEKLFAWLQGFLPRSYRMYFQGKSEVIHFKLGQWVRGQLLLCMTIGILVFVALLILGVPYAVTLALFAAVTEFIPIIGPLIAAVPAVLIAGSQHGFVFALIVAGVYYSIQWCENNLLVPIIMKRAVGLSPIAVTFAMLVGISFPGIINPILGIILSIPITTIVALFLEDWREMRLQKEHERR